MGTKNVWRGERSHEAVGSAGTTEAGATHMQVHVKLG